MAGTSNSITTHNVLSGVLNADNVISGLVNTAFNPAYALVTQAGAQIVLFINNNDYKMYAQLKDKNGNLIYTSNIIDLPLETMVVAGRYDSNTKKLILVLDNGNEIEVPLEALISGLVNEDDLIANYYDKDEIDALLDGYWTKIELTQEDIDNWNAADAAFQSELFDDGVISIEDSTEANINNTMNKSQLKIDLKGNTSQESTTGKNLFSGDYSQFDSQGGEGTTYAYFKLPDDNKQYTLTMIAKNDFTATGNTFLGFTGIGGNSTGGVNWIITQALGTITKGTILSKTSNSVNRFVSLYNKGADYLKNLVDNFDIQLEEGETASEYEPYTGGNPAPSPDYPMSVNVVTGDNEVKVEGKNLATENFNDSTTGIALSKTVESGTPIYISSNINNTVNVLYAFMDSTFKGNILVTYSNGKITYSGTPNFTFNRVRCPSDRICTESILALGSTATTYEEYKEQTYPINLGSMELCKIGDYQDYIAKSTGKNLLDKVNNLFQGSYGTTTGGDNSVINTPLRCCTKKIDLSNVTGSLTFTGNYFELYNFYDAEDNLVSSAATTTTTIPENAKSVRLRFYNNNQNLSLETLQGLNLMLANSSVAIEYEPYGKVWYKYNAIGKAVVDGSEDWKKSGDARTISYYYASSNDVNYKFNGIKTNIMETTGASSVYPAYSTHFKFIANVTLFSDIQGAIFDKISNVIELRFGFGLSTSISTLELFKQWLSDNNVTVYFPLATPTAIPIIDTTLIEQLDNLEKAYSYNSQTNISQTNQDKPFILDINAIADNVNGLKLENENQEYKTNKVIELSSNSTDDEYPSAKCVYDIVGNIEAVLAAMDSGSGV